MVRRWSCLNIKSSITLFPRFEIKKIAKALNFRNYNLGITKYKRKKLGKWKRFNNNALFVQIFKHWVKEYYFTKKTTRSLIYESMLAQSFYAQDGLTIKKKTPLAVRQFFFFNLTAFTSTFFNYLNKAGAGRGLFTLYTQCEKPLTGNLISVPGIPGLDKEGKVKYEKSQTINQVEEWVDGDEYLSIVSAKIEFDTYSLEILSTKYRFLAAYLNFLYQMYKADALVVYKIFISLFFINLK